MCGPSAKIDWNIFSRPNHSSSSVTDGSVSESVNCISEDSEPQCQFAIVDNPQVEE